MGIPLQVSKKEGVKEGVTLSINNKDLYNVISILQSRLSIRSQGLVLASIFAEFLEASPLLAMARNRDDKYTPLAWTVSMGGEGLKSIKATPVGDYGTIITMLEERREAITKAIAHVRKVIDKKIVEVKETK